VSVDVADLHRKPAGVVFARRSSAGLAVLMAVLSRQLCGVDPPARLAAAHAKALDICEIVGGMEPKAVGHERVDEHDQGDGFISCLLP